MLLTGLCCLASATLSSAQEYKPIFSEEVLAQADPEARKRMAALEQQNKERWLSRQSGAAKPVAPASGTAPARESSGGGGDQLMRYVDSQGVTHFSRNPPAGVDALPVDVATDNPSAAEIEERRAILASEQAALEDFAERRRVAERRSAQVEAQLVARQQQRTACRDLFNDIQDYRRGGTVYYDLNEYGERVYWSEARLAQEINELEARYSGSCGSLEKANDADR